MRPRLSYFFVGALFWLSCSSNPSGTPPSETVEPGPPVGQTEPLSKEKAAKLLKRLPDLQEQASDIKEFNLRDRSLPPPKTAKTLQLAFSPSDSLPPESVPTGDLKLLRHAPDGEIPISPSLSLTFSQPMVPLSNAQKLSADQVPVKLTPQPEGEWRWLGDKTLVFEPAGERMPAATEYKVEVPAGTKSATGGTLIEAQTFTFATPAPLLQHYYPYSYTPSGLSPILFMVFDQRVDSAAILKALQVKSPAAVTLHIATEEELKTDKQLQSEIKRLPKGTWAAFAFDQKLAQSTNVSLLLPKGAYSSEGPRTTLNDLSFTFSTYGAFQATQAGCEYPGSKTCYPTSGWYVYFNNTVDSAKVKKESFKITPAPKSYTVSAYGGTDVYLYGEFNPNTTYSLTATKDLVDIFGQNLSAEKTFSIKVGPAAPSLTGPSQQMVVLDPLGEKAFSVFSTGHKELYVSIYSVEPSQYQEFTKYISDRYLQPPPSPPGKLLEQKTIAIANPNEKTESRIDLAGSLPTGIGHAVVVVKAPKPATTSDYYYYDTEVNVWVQSTKIGLDAFTDSTDATVYVSSLQDGTPLSGVEVSFTNNATKVTSDANGIASLKLTPSISLFGTPPPAYLIAKKGDDAALLTDSWGGNVGYFQTNSDQLVWYIFDDRHLYRPGEEAKIKGWIRKNNFGKGGDLKGLEKGATKLSYILRDAYGNEVAKGDSNLNALGGFDFSLKLPDTMNLGSAYLTLSAASFMDGKEAYHYFEVQEFRRPEFEVKVNAGEGPFFINGEAELTADAQYYTGGGLPSAPVTWYITTSQGYFTPPNLSDYTFGTGGGSPYFWDEGYYGGYGKPPAEPQKVEGITDTLGKHSTKIALKPGEKPQPQSIYAEATVMDVNQQAWSASTTLLVHPSDLYVGLKSDKYFVEKDQEYPVDVIVSDIDGKKVEQKKVEIQFASVRWEYKEGKYEEIQGEAENCTITSSQKDERCSFHPKEGGQHRALATVTDDKGRKNQSSLSVWVSGETNASKTLEQERVTIIPDKKEYQPGDVAKVLIISPFSPAEGVLLVRRSGIIKSEHFSIKESSTTVSIPIEEGYTPELGIEAALSGQSVRAGKDGKPDESLPKRPAFAAGYASLPVPPKSRTLSLEVKAKHKEVAPGVETSIEVVVKDASGKAVKDADVAVMVVDEAVLSLGGYQTPNPISSFYGGRYDTTRDYRLRSLLQLEDPTKLPAPTPETGGLYRNTDEEQNMPVGQAAANLTTPAFSATLSPAAPAAGKKVVTKTAEKQPMLDAVTESAGEATAAPGIQLRSDFASLALFVGSSTTDKKGKAIIKYKLPDNLTRYRIVAVAAARDTEFGVGEDTVTAKLPLMARASPPRFLNFGDTALVPVVLQNQTDKPMTVEVAMRATSLVSVQADGFVATIPPNDRLEVRFPVLVQDVGTVRFQVAAAGRGNKARDASEFSLPIYTPATTEANALYGQLDEGAVEQPISAPTDAFPNFGGLEITTSSTALSALTDAVVYLVKYPYECAEQLASRDMAIASLKDVLSAFKAPGLPAESELKAQVAKDLKRLKQLQHYSGGFDFWRSDKKPWPYLSVHVTHALARAKEKGFEVPADLLSRAQSYTQNIESYLYDERYNDEAKDVIIAYALYVRMLLGDIDTYRAKTLLKKGFDKLSIESVGWILAVLANDTTAGKEREDILTFLLSRVAESAGEAHFTTSYREEDSYVLLSSDRRADAILLDALIRAEPKSDLIPKLVAGLLNHKTEGRWGSTQENSFVLIALDNYFNTYEKATPEFVAKVWLGEAYAGEESFHGRSTDQKNMRVPMGALMEQGGKPSLVLSKEGPGRLYYRIGLSYAPKKFDLKPVDFGFTVTRTYEGADNPEDVTQAADGTWKIKAGARVKVKLKMVAPTRRYHVALVDPLPAGFEALNPALNGTGSTPPDPAASEEARYPSGKGWWYWWGPWYEHENLRDERVEAFTTLLWEGVYKYDYIARATTPGTFIVPPTKAEEMYSPEIFGRTGTDRVIIDPPANKL